MTYPFLCPVCSCPLQLLADCDNGCPTGTIEDAQEAHNTVCHKGQVVPE